MAGSRMLSSDAGRGRPTVDWEQAFAYYASLDPRQRTYQAVARRFGTSARTVERHGREERWQQRLREIQSEVATSTNATIAQSRVEQVTKTIRLIEATFIGYAEKLRRGEMRMVPGDLERLNRLLEQLHEQVATAPAATVEPPAAAAPRAPEHVSEVIAALAESGALEALGLQPIPTTDPEPELATTPEPESEAAWMAPLTSIQLAASERLLDHVGPLRLRFCPLTPTARQEAFLRLRTLEVLYGGAAGGGKTIALLMSALEYADVPGYHALLLRPSLTEFALPGGLIELAHDWLTSSKAVWSAETNSWRFPGPGKAGAGGASLHFGYLDGSKDLSRYAGTSFSFVGFDELVLYQEQDYRRMFRVLRQPTTAPTLPAAPDGTTLRDVPVRMRATSNPGGPNHGWVKSYFVTAETRRPGVRFLPARLQHNPHLDPSYIEALAVLPPAERERLLNGDWEIPDDGELFQRDWFEQIEHRQLPTTMRAVRYWDLAATEPGPAAPDPDYTVGLRLEIDDTSGTFYISDIIRTCKAAGAVEELVAATATRDGREVEIGIEEEPGAAGKAVSARYKRHVLRGCTVSTDRPTGAKDVRARPVAAAAENGLVKIVRGANSNDFLDEVCSFPHAPHDDCVDALAGAHKKLAVRHGTGSVHVPQGNLYDYHPSRRRRPRSAAEAREWLRREEEQLARLAGTVGLPYTYPRYY